MKNKKKVKPAYAIFIIIALAVGAAGTWTNAANLNISNRLCQSPLSPPDWLFPIVWTVLYVLMGVSAARVWLSSCEGKSDALFIWGVQLAVNYLWTVFFFSFNALLLSFLWLVFLILTVILMILRFRQCDAQSAKLQVPYLIWLIFAAYLNLMLWLLNK